MGLFQNCSDGYKVKGTSEPASTSAGLPLPAPTPAPAPAPTPGPVPPPTPLPPGSPSANASLVALAANSVQLIGPFMCTNPVGDAYSCKVVSDYSGMVYDASQFKFFLFGGGHATTYTDTVFEFNPSTLKWSELYAPSPACVWMPSN